MRTLLSLAGLYIVHRGLLHLFPAYRATMQRIDRQLTWVSAILVLYFLLNALLRLF
ncbi:MAG: hypothetical protein AB7N91_00740 [Candidatus Tectimicrobiota bacterium]